jgi:deoxyribodipyrimidine photo-lyase
MEEFDKWCKGETGIPLVDAGMRELNQTGFMHNRVRMICASFLCKNLLVDWRMGEAYFASKLLDFELASNNGNWQWSAGTGCDSAPYFRVFNPETQQKRFDPEQKYIRKWIENLDELTYPNPMVDLKSSRVRAIETYKSSINS